MKSDISPSSKAVSRDDDLREAIRHRAEKIYVESGRIPGRDRENWERAEQEIRREALGSVQRMKSAIVIRVDGVEFVGEFDKELSDGYAPGEFNTGGAVSVRFEGNKMFVRRPNGRELATQIVKKTG